MKYISPMYKIKKLLEAEYFQILFGIEFMESTDKGTIIEYAR